MFTTGIFLTLLRINEPYFYFVFYKTIMEFFGEVLSEEDLIKEESLDDTLSTFLSSSLNVELVHIILKGITIFAKADL